MGWIGWTGTSIGRCSLFLELEVFLRHVREYDSVSSNDRLVTWLGAKLRRCEIKDNIKIYETIN